MRDRAAAEEDAAVLVGRYELRRLIARGGMGEVFEAQDRQLQRRVAVKVFRAAAEDRARFDAEVVTLAALSHPNLVQVYDAGEHDGEAFVVLELVDGPTLASRLRDDGPASLGDVASIGARIADALAYVHANGVVHRDVTPSNILCGADARPRLADFGIARLVDTTRVTAPATAIGTAAYMAPEQVMGDDVTPAADVYALGLVLLELLTGARAFAGTAKEAAVARLARPPAVPGDLPGPWRRLLRDMTRRAPDARPSAAEVRDRLASISAGPSVGTASVGATAPMTASAPVGVMPAGATAPRTAPVPVGTAVAAAAPEATAAFSLHDTTAVAPGVAATTAAPAPHDADAGGGPRRVPVALLVSFLVGLTAVLAVVALAGDADDGRPPATTTVAEPLITEPTVTQPQVTAASTEPPPTTAITPDRPERPAEDEKGDEGNGNEGKGNEGKGNEGKGSGDARGRSNGRGR